MTKKREKTLSVGAFNLRSVAIIDDVASGRIDRVVLTRRGRPVAALIPIGDTLPDPWGAMRGSIRVMPGVDLTEPIGEVWDADRSE
jgi:antitoxin (DNA-binding transcriptional repressor) of toxin-antitoxin stability system